MKSKVMIVNAKKDKFKHLYRSFDRRIITLKVINESIEGSCKMKEEDLELSNEMKRNKKITIENKFNSRNIETDPYSKRKIKTDNKGVVIERRIKKENDIQDENIKKEDVEIVLKRKIDKDDQQDIDNNGQMLGNVEKDICIEEQNVDDLNDEINNSNKINTKDISAHITPKKKDKSTDKDNAETITHQDTTNPLLKPSQNDNTIKEDQSTHGAIIKSKTVLKANPQNKPKTMIPIEPTEDEEITSNTHNRESSESLRKAYKNRNIQPNDEQSSSNEIDDKEFNSPKFPQGNRPGFGSSVTFKQVSDTEEDNIHNKESKKEDPLHQTITKIPKEEDDTEKKKTIIDSPFHNRKMKYAHFGLGNKQIENKKVNTMTLDNKKEDSGYDSNELVKGIEATDEYKESLIEDVIMKEDIAERPILKANRPKRKNIEKDDIEQEKDIIEEDHVNQEEINIKKGDEYKVNQKGKNKDGNKLNQEKINIQSEEIDDNTKPQSIHELRKSKYKTKKPRIIKKENESSDDIAIHQDNKEREREYVNDNLISYNKEKDNQDEKVVDNPFSSVTSNNKETEKDDDIPLSDNSNNKEKDITDPQNSKNNPSSSHFQPLNTNRSLLPELNQALENEPESLITPYNKDPLSSEQEIIPSTDPLQKPSSNPLFTSQPHKSAMASVDCLSPIKPSKPDQFIFPYETYIEVLDTDKSPHIIPLSLLLSSQGPQSSTIEDSLTGQIFTFYPSKFNPSNELSHILILKDNEGSNTPVKKMYLRKLIDKVSKCETIKDEEEVIDTSFNRHFIPKREALKLVNNSRLAECVTENENNPYIEVHDLKGNNYELEKSDFKRIFDNISKGNPPLKKETFKTSKGDSVLLNPFTLRPFNVKSNDKASVSNSKSKSRKSSVSSKTPLQTSFMTFSSNIKENIPYTLIDHDNNSYYKVTNLLSYKQDFLSKQKILSLIFSKDASLTKMYSKDELKLVVNKNNSRNEYIKLPSNKFIKKHHMTTLLNSLVENKLIPLSIQVLSHNNELITVDTKSSLLSLYEITPSPYMKDEILHIADITYYYDPLSKNFIKKDSSRLSSLISKEDLAKPGIELFEFIKVEDVQSIPLFISKPFIRHQLYNENITANIEVTDIENHNRVISMISLISKFTKLDMSNLSQTRINDPIPNCMLYYDVNEVGNGKLHLTAKEKIKLANRKLKNEKSLAGINLVDVKGRVFNALIESNRISLYDSREWVQITDENGEDIYIYKSVIRHILDDDDENSISCYRAVTTNSERRFELNQMMETNERVNTVRENNNLLEEEEDIVNVVDYYCKRKRISRKAVRTLITNYNEMNSNKNSVVVQQVVAKKN